MYQHILAAYDGSEASRKALQQAVAIAKGAPGTKLTVVHALYQPTYAFGEFGFIPPEDYDRRVKEYEAKLLDEAKDQAASLSNVDFAVLTGYPASAILEYAKQNNCDLIVMGSRGLGAVREWMLGSVSHYVVQRAQIPVLIVK
ncbi:universal stress protein [Cohnella pontilimi]|uniref:Universal stress protein n=1 Tax=Cohnella pontilimi TaxID=2564100 RepID=A0A4U0F9F5_9BACL|nr:universal stress protein [Cohnella pontilimi]TJY41128.1 universal stress protein [Cohnella pontilimi]